MSSWGSGCCQLLATPGVTLSTTLASSSFLPWGLYSCPFFLWDVLSAISPLSPWRLLVSPLCGDSGPVTSVTWLFYSSWPELSYPNVLLMHNYSPNLGFLIWGLFVSFTVEVKFIWHKIISSMHFVHLTLLLMLNNHHFYPVPRHLYTPENPNRSCNHPWKLPVCFWPPP